MTRLRWATDAQTEQLVEAATARLGPDCSSGMPAVGRAAQRLPQAIVACLRARADQGVQKYGTALSVGWPPATAGAYQEALDLVMYLAADADASPFERALARKLAISLAKRLVGIDTDRTTVLDAVKDDKGRLWCAYLHLNSRNQVVKLYLKGRQGWWIISDDVPHISDKWTGGRHPSDVAPGNTVWRAPCNRAQLWRKLEVAPHAGAGIALVITTMQAMETPHEL